MLIKWPAIAMSQKAKKLLVKEQKDPEKKKDLVSSHRVLPTIYKRK